MSQTVPDFRTTSLRCRVVELTTLNKALLGRQPKLFELFLSVVYLRVFFVFFFRIFVNLFLSSGIYFDCLFLGPEKALEMGRWLKEDHFERAQWSNFIQGVFLNT